MQGFQQPTGGIVAPEPRAGKIAAEGQPQGVPAAPPVPRRIRRAAGMPARTLVRLFFVGLFLLVGLQADWHPPLSAWEAVVRTATADRRFDLVGWELNAIGEKVGDFLRNPAKGLTVAEEKALVVDYLEQARRAGQIEDEIERVFADPEQPDAEAATAHLRAQLAALQADLAEKAPAVEAVLERQLSRQVEAAGLTKAGIAWPPPRVSFTEPPKLLVVSPRDRIQRLRSVDLLPESDGADDAHLEREIEANSDLAAYVTGIGGYGAYPTIVVNRYGLGWTLETIAHEWIHNYLTFHRLGWAFLEGGEAVTINETVASIAGEELGSAMLEAYYPEFSPPPAPASETTEPIIPAEPPPFDFGQEMRATRVTVDSLLEQGRVEEAEAYMETRRQEFVRNGYRLRVLNQAYFAFHGSYATGPAATDPIGPKLQHLRQLSGSLAEFLRLVDGITSQAEIDALLAGLEMSQGG